MFPTKGFKKTAKRTLYLSTAIVLGNVINVSAEGNYSLAQDIADNYVKSFPSEKIVEEKHDKDWKVRDVRPPKIGDATMRSVVFNRIFHKSGTYDLVQEHMSPILNQYAWNDLKLFYGSTSAPRFHLMTHINKTVTTLGEGVLATLLVTPTNNMEELEGRQRIVKTFLNDTEALKQLRESLKYYQDAENSLLSLWTSNDPLYTKEYKNYMEGYFYAKYGDSSNKRSGWLEFKKRAKRDFLDIQFKFIYPVFWHGIMEAFGAYTPDHGNPYANNYMHSGVSQRKYYWMGAIPLYGGYYKWDKVDPKRLGSSTKTWAGVGSIFGEAMYVWSVYSGVCNYLEYSDVLKNLALRMADVQAFVRAAREVNECIAASPELEAVYGSRLSNIRKLLARAKESGEMGALMNYLETLPYKSWSYFFNNAGKLLASHMLFTEHRDEFADAMYDLGQLDAFTSVSVLVKESQDYNSAHCFTFTKFLSKEQKSRPYVKLEDMWNPFLDSKVAVGNDLVMDAADGGVRNITLTGPNAGGKSTFLTGVTSSILLSQSFGIAPAKEAVITPFDKINTYIDIADDIAAGKSLFMAEVDRAQKHINLITSLKPNEFAFTIFDEPFSGTNPTEGAAAEYSILEALGDYSNTLNITATHYPIVMLLEERARAQGFVNYKVYITQDASRKINYTYKVIPGKSNQAIAIDILEEQGYDVRMLKRARDIIEHPEKYKSTFKE